ncbi:MAG: hypothetical protein HY720_04440 [Planctomycetes bacterium]|nr:hypothetical protein [Planctomycetota bacterium]
MRCLAVFLCVVSFVAGCGAGSDEPAARDEATPKVEATPAPEPGPAGKSDLVRVGDKWMTPAQRDRYLAGDGQEPRTGTEDARTTLAAPAALPGGASVALAVLADEKAPDGPSVMVAARCALPAGAVLDLSIEFAGQSFDHARAPLAGETFEVQFGPYGARKLLAGRYRVWSTYDPERQSPEVRAARDQAAVAETWLEVGDGARRAREAREREERYRAILAAIDDLDREMRAEWAAAERGEKYLVGGGGKFDPFAWREWCDGWRARMEARRQELQELDAREVVALAFPRARSILADMTLRYLALHRAWSRDLLELRSLPLDPADAEGPLSDISSVPSLVATIRDLRVQFERFWEEARIE